MDPGNMVMAAIVAFSAFAASLTSLNFSQSPSASWAGGQSYIPTAIPFLFKQGIASCRDSVLQFGSFKSFNLFDSVLSFTHGAARPTLSFLYVLYPGITESH